MALRILRTSSPVLRAGSLAREARDAEDAEGMLLEALVEPLVLVRHGVEQEVRVVLSQRATFGRQRIANREEQRLIGRVVGLLHHLTVHGQEIHIVVAHLLLEHVDGRRRMLDYRRRAAG